MQNFVHRGETLDFLAPYNVNGGGGFKVGNIFAVAVETVLSGAALAGMVQGVFDLAKDTSTFNEGDKVYWNDALGQCTSSRTTAAGVANLEIGYASLTNPSGTNALGGGSGDATVRVRLTPTSFALIGSSDIDPGLLQKATVALSAANILAMNGTPVPILPALAAGQVLVIDQIVVQFKAGSTQFASGGAVTFQYHGTSVNPHAGNVPAATINSASSSNNVLAPPSAVIQPPTATGLEITNGTGAFTTGNGTAIVTVYYSILTLG